MLPGGSYTQGDKYSLYSGPEHPASVSAFKLDRFEVTVGRFRKFVEAYPGSKPAPGDGAHPLHPETGWDPVWDSFLAADATELRANVACSPAATWTDVPSGGEDLPMSCLRWFDAFAFCAWDGGRLPSESEWEYAARGGSMQRSYPWGETEPDASLAVFKPHSIKPVGSLPAGDGLWGNADLAGNVAEWVFDTWTNFGYANVPCNDCVLMKKEYAYHILRGGSFRASGPSGALISYIRVKWTAAGTLGPLQDLAGVRCVRSP